MFEEKVEREKIIKSANELLDISGQSHENRYLILNEYRNKGIGNFIVFMKELESKIDSNKKDEYNSFLDYLNKKIKE